jgi:hypothetical protein
MAVKIDTEELIRRAMSELGKRTSKKKAKAAKENGKKGGRPKKIRKSPEITPEASSPMFPTPRFKRKDLT